MRRKWIIVYIVLFFLPFIALLILGKMGFFEQKPAPEQPQGYTVALYRHKTQTVEQIPLRDYLSGVLAGEMPASYPEEALKAQAVASYSYLLHRKNSIAEHPDSDFGNRRSEYAFRSVATIPPTAKPTVPPPKRRRLGEPIG